MSDSTTQTNVHEMLAQTRRLSVEEEYLDTLLSPAVENTGQSDAAQASQQVVDPVPLDTPEQKQVDIPSEANGNIESGVNRHSPFDCRLIRLEGLKLAVPESALYRVLPWPRVLFAASGCHAWILKQAQDEHGVLDIVNLSAVIHMRDPESVENENYSDYRSIIQLHDGKTCLPCDDVLDTVSVNPECVCWRDNSSQRLWLAGTVRQEAYAILDVEGMMRMLTG